MKNGNPFETDWNNIDFADDFESHLHLIDGLTFDTLFIEIEHNCPVIDEKAVTAQFETDLNHRVREARGIFRANLANITKKALENRAQI